MFLHWTCSPREPYLNKSPDLSCLQCVWQFCGQEIPVFVLGGLFRSLAFPIVVYESNRTVQFGSYHIPTALYLSLRSFPAALGNGNFVCLWFRWNAKDKDRVRHALSQRQENRGCCIQCEPGVPALHPRGPKPRTNKLTRLLFCAMDSTCCLLVDKNEAFEPPTHPPNKCSNSEARGSDFLETVVPPPPPRDPGSAGRVAVRRLGNPIQIEFRPGELRCAESISLLTRHNQCTELAPRRIRSCCERSLVGRCISLTCVCVCVCVCVRLGLLRVTHTHSHTYTHVGPKC